MADSIENDAGSLVPSPTSTAVFVNDRKVFLLVSGVVTLLPLIFVSAFSNVRSSSVAVNNIFSLLLLMSTMHVALTSFFFYDRRYAEHFREHKLYYVFLPVIVILTTGAGYQLLGSSGVAHIFLFYHAWLLFHYGRQNYGMLCFVGIATDGPRPFRFERAVLHLAPIAGILGAMPLLEQGKRSVFGAHLDLFYTTGAVFMTAACLLLAVQLYDHIRRRQSPWRIFFLTLLTAFYLPTFFFDKYFPAVMGYAIAHALQYFVFMFYVAADNMQGKLHRRLMTFVSLAIGGWIVIWLTRDASLWGQADAFAAGASLGIVMSHFIIDAGVWKLSQPFPRRAVRESFSFLFR